MHFTVALTIISLLGATSAGPVPECNGGCVSQGVCYRELEPSQIACEALSPGKVRQELEKCILDTWGFNMNLDKKPSKDVKEVSDDANKNLETKGDPAFATSARPNSRISQGSVRPELKKAIPVEPESVEQKSVEQEPVEQEPVEEPVEQVPVKQGSVRPELEKTIPVKQEPVKQPKDVKVDVLTGPSKEPGMEIQPKLERPKFQQLSTGRPQQQQPTRPNTVEVKMEDSLLTQDSKRPTTGESKKPIGDELKKPIGDELRRPVAEENKKPIAGDVNKPLREDVKKVTGDEVKPTGQDLKSTASAEKFGAFSLADGLDSPESCLVDACELVASLDEDRHNAVPLANEKKLTKSLLSVS